jgi:hypothetical protein
MLRHQHPRAREAPSAYRFARSVVSLGRARARAISKDARMRVLASWALGFYETVPREACARLRCARDKTKPHTPRRVCAFG